MTDDSKQQTTAGQPPLGQKPGAWQLRARFCPLCGGSLAPTEIAGRTRQRCAPCNWVLYANPASAAAAAVIDRELRVLLIRRSLAPHQGSWALPAGYQEMDENPQDAVEREVLEETGARIEVGPLLDVIYIADDPRKPANVIIYLCRFLGGEVRGADDAMEAAFFPLDQLPENIGFDNTRLVLEPLRHRIEAGEWNFEEPWDRSPSGE
ncbi:MAG: 8-oxo-dGTP diphosphatase [Planctomycetota bacterium]